jgi:hypothetical protein
MYCDLFVCTYFFLVVFQIVIHRNVSIPVFTQRLKMHVIQLAENCSIVYESISITFDNVVAMQTFGLSGQGIA